MIEGLKSRGVSKHEAFPLTFFGVIIFILLILKKPFFQRLKFKLLAF